MVTPAPTLFPTPQSFPFPEPDPQTYGLSPYQQNTATSLYLPQSVVPETSPMSAQPTNYLANLTQQLFGQASSGDPNELTLQDAQQQTDRALARIEQVNPELASTLSAQRGDQPDGDKGFWGTIMSTVASSPIGKALEIISRPAKIVPEILTDTDESVWKNVGDALLGKSTNTMGNVLEKYNILQGDDMFSKISRGVTAFALDVAVDPTTYLTLGMGSVGRAMATRLGSKVAFETGIMATEEGMSVVDHVVATLGREGVGVAADASLETARGGALKYLWNGITDGTISSAKLGKFGALGEDLTAVSQDFLGGPLGTALEAGQAEAYRGAIKAADEAHKLIGKFGFNRIDAKLAEAAGIPYDEMKAALQGMKKAGAFGSREAYMEAKAAGALLGGARFSIPGIRMISPALWGTGKLDFSIARRFFSGLSGQQRIMRAVAGGFDAQLGKDALEWATLGGWTAVEKNVPQVAKLFGGPAGTLGSMAAKASWEIGGITKHLGSAALLRGGGLGTALAADARKMSRSVMSNLMHDSYLLASGDDNDLLGEIAEKGARLDTVGDIVKHGRGQATMPEVQRMLHGLDRAAIDATGDDMIVNKIIEAFPNTEAMRMGADAYYSQLEAQVRVLYARDPAKMQTALENLAKRKQLAKTLETTMKDTPEAELAARLYHHVTAKATKVANELGIHVRNVTTSVEDQLVVNPGNRDVIDNGHALQHGKDYVLDDESLESAADGPGYGLGHVTDGEMGRGYQLHEQETVPLPEPGATGAPPPRPVQLAGRLENKVGDSVGDIAPEDVQWVRTDELYGAKVHDAPDSPLARENRESLTGVPGEGHQTSLEDEIRTNGYDAPIEAMVDDQGGLRITNGNHHLEAAHNIGDEWVPVRVVKPAEGPMGVPATAGQTLDEIYPGRFSKRAAERTEPGVPLPAPPGRKRAASAMKRPAIWNKDEEAVMAKARAGENKPPVGTSGPINPIAEADEFADNTMAMLGENWDPQITKILGSPRFRGADKEVRDMLRKMGLDPENMTDEMRKIALEEQASIRARIKTAYLKEKGYDGVIVIEGGKQHITVFEDGFLTGDKAPIWEISDAAPFISPDRGYFHRTMQGHIHEMLKGRRSADDTRGPAEWDATFARETKDMNFDEAEAHIRGQLREMGIAINDDVEVLERDVSANLNGYVDGMAKKAGNVYLGREAKRLENLGLGRSPFVGNFVGPQYEAVPSTAYMNTGNWLKNQSEKLYRVAQKMATHQQKVAKAGQAEYQRIEKVIADLNEQLHGKIDDELNKTERVFLKQTNPNAEMGALSEDAIRSNLKDARASMGGAKRAGQTQDLGNGINKWVTGDGRTVYFMQDANGNITSYRWRTADGQVQALRDPAYKGQGYDLLKQDMKDQGITSFAALRKDLRNQKELSIKGAASRRRFMQEELTPELAPRLRKQIEAKEAELEAARQRVNWQLMTQKDVLNEYNRIMHDAHARVAEPKVALRINEPNLTGMSPLDIPGLQGMHMPATMADEFNFAARGYKHLNEFQKVWRRHLSLWKEWSTWAWPGFHIRNMMGGWFNNWLGGVQFKDYVETFRAMRARREILTGKTTGKSWANEKLSRDFINRHGLASYYLGSEPTYGDLSNLFTEHAIHTANSRSFGEARVGAELMDKEMAKPASSPWTLVDSVTGKTGKRSVLGKPGRTIAGALRQTGEMTENMLRGASFLQGLKQYGGDFMAAHSFTMMRHGDYGDLSDWEYGAIRDVIPFYKWMRTNTPLQIHQLFESPGKLMATLHARDAAFTGLGLDENDLRSKMPEWATEGLAIPLPGSSDEAVNLVTMDLPMNDLFQGAGEFFSQMVPLARPAFESYVTEKSLFTGAPIEGKPVKVGWVNDVPFLGKLLSGINIGKMGADGDYYIDDKLQNVLGVVPVFSRFRNWIYEDPARSKLRAGTLISATFGIGVRPFGQQEFRNEELDFYYSTIIPTLEYLKTMGYPLPTTDDVNALYGSANNVLLAAGIPARGGV